MVDLDPASDLARFSASDRARLTSGSDCFGGSGGGSGNGGGVGGLGGFNGPTHMIQSPSWYGSKSCSAGLT